MDRFMIIAYLLIECVINVITHSHIAFNVNDQQILLTLFLIRIVQLIKFTMIFISNIKTPKTTTTLKKKTKN